MFYIKTEGAESWRALLADPALHWRTGYSARTLACCWESAAGLPPEIAALFGAGSSLLLALPEHKVDLPGGVRPSQTDLFVLMRKHDQTIACAVEGKVEEPFGPTVGEWLNKASLGKLKRLEAISAILGIKGFVDHSLRYQLLHRTASAIIEAERFKTNAAAMIVHSFSMQKSWFQDYAAFVSVMGRETRADELVTVELPSGMPLMLGWATGDPQFLES